MASPETKAASGYPVSMGPGARPMKPGESAQSRDEFPGRFSQFAEQRSKYSVVREPSGMRVGYELKDIPRNHFIAFENVPIGGLINFVCYGNETSTFVTGTFVIDIIRGIENMSGKMLTQTQAEAVTLHASKKMLYSQSALYMAVVGGAYVAWRGRKDMKFPFIKPKAPERYASFPSRYLSVLQGQYARTMWHITRGIVWIGLGAFALGPLMNSMGMSSMIAGLYRDDRTKEMMKNLKGSLTRVDANMARSGAPGQTAPPDDSYRTDDNSSSAFSDTGVDSSNAPDRDNYVDSRSDQSYYDEDAESVRQARQQASPPRRSLGSSSQPAQDRGSGSSDFFFDDASPTAGNDPDMGNAAPHQRPGSAWDRVRGSGRGQRSQPPRQPLPSRLPPRDEEESFSFSSGDEEKAVAKQQAQKEFDAMLERERRESGSGDYDRGSQAAQYGQENAGGGVGAALGEEEEEVDADESTSLVGLCIIITKSLEFSCEEKRGEILEFCTSRLQCDLLNPENSKGSHGMPLLEMRRVYLRSRVAKTLMNLCVMVAHEWDAL